MKNVTHRRARQKGAVIILTALALLALLGFMGIAMDFGHLFVVKTELQTAADSCALAAAQELDGGSDALPTATDPVGRATRAGMIVGNLNKVNFQGAAAGIVATDITFSDSLIGAYDHTFTPVANAKYAKCTIAKLDMAPWLLQAMGAFTGNAAYGANQSVGAVAVATRAPGQGACNALPVQIKPKSPASACGVSTFYGYCPGEWIPSVYNENNNNTPPMPGQFGWGNLDGSTNANETKAELGGNTPCNLKTGDAIGTPGGKVAASLEWNSRFGLYKNGTGSPSVTTHPPDTTGYAYAYDPGNPGPPFTPPKGNWPSRANAVGDFLAKRADFRSYGDLVDSVNAGDTITGLNVKGGYHDPEMATHAAGARALATNGRSRRLMVAPIVAASSITDWACVLMLAPIDGPTTTVYLELVGNASASNSPCVSSTLPGAGSTGPLVPVLVQ